MTGVRIAAGLGVDLGHERADRVNDPQPALPAVLAHRRRHAVSGEHADLPRWNLFLGIDEDRAHALEALDDMVVVDDLVPDIHGRAVPLKQALDDLDRAV